MLWIVYKILIRVYYWQQLAWYQAISHIHILHYLSVKALTWPDHRLNNGKYFLNEKRRLSISLCPKHRSNIG